jgi:branched-subunit amino acid aminotransferase/4-amino-4-deoxychorismate lyase
MSVIFLNGRFVDATRAKVSVFDRGFLYGDGVFETLRLSDGEPQRWDQHAARFLGGATCLKIRVPRSPGQLRAVARELALRNRVKEAVLRMQLTRGLGPRGYAIRAAKHPTLVMSLHPAPPSDGRAPLRWKLITASLRLPVGDALSRFKTCNRLHYLLARAEAEAAGADDALLLNARGEVVETSCANLFWTDGRT